MNCLNFFTSLYALLRPYSCVPPCLLSPLRKIVRLSSNMVLPHYLAASRKQSGCLAGRKVIVSLTSFPDRIGIVWMVVECMLRQTYQPYKILLWLSKDQFNNIDEIPISLRHRINDIFEIRFVDGDIKSHKKYYYAAREYPNDLIFLIDDDLFYPNTILERSIDAYNTHSQCVIGNYGYIMLYDSDGHIRSYSSWKENYKETFGYELFVGSGGGTLFCPLQLDSALTDIANAITLCPTADDVWLNAMIRLAHTPIYMIKHGLISPITNKSLTLYSSNVGKGLNDQQISAVNHYYCKMNNLNVFDKYQ